MQELGTPSAAVFGLNLILVNFSKHVVQSIIDQHQLDYVLPES